MKPFHDGLVILGCVFTTLAAAAQSAPLLLKEAISREVSVFVGAEPDPAFREVVSREVSVFIGAEAEPPFRQVMSREVSVVVTTPASPARITQLTVNASPTSQTTALSWAGYNEIGERDVARYDIYLSTRPFTNVVGMTRYATVPAETFALTLTNLAAWVDRFYAVVAVDAAGNADPVVDYRAVYVLAREVVSREFSVFIGAEPEPPLRQVVSREVSLVVTTPEAPLPVTQLTVAGTPTGEQATLSWGGYNELGQRDVARYDIYRASLGFTDVTGMTRYATVPAESLTITLTNLPGWQDHFFAVVPVDAAGSSDPRVNYAASYPLAREVVSREFSVFVGDEPEPPFREVASREVSVLISTPEVPAPVTGLGSGFAAAGSTLAYRAIDLDWSSYNEIGQRDVVRYRVYAGPAYFDDVSGMEPYAFVPAESRGATVMGLDPLGIYHVAVVAEDANGAWNTIVRSASAQAAIDRLGEVRNLAVRCETNALHFTWQPPDFAEPFLESYRVYLGGAGLPVVLGRAATNYSATSLLPAHGYPLRITTVDKFGTESGGASLLAATLLEHPSNPRAHPLDGMVRLTWEHVEPNEIVYKYAVYVATTNFTSVAGKEPVLLTRARRADLSGLVDGTPYFFAVTTVNIAGGEPREVRTVSATPAARGGAFADLMTTNVVAPLLVYPGRTGAFGWEVLNVGVASTSREDLTPVMTWSDRLILSADDVLGDADDIVVADLAHTGSLDPGVRYTTNVTVVVPRISPGRYHVFVVSDVADDVYEHLDPGDNAGGTPQRLAVRLAFPPADVWVDEGVLLSVTNVPVAADLPEGTLRFALDHAPEGMTIDASTGVIRWQPDEAQGPGTNVVTVSVTDTGAPPLNEINEFIVMVREVNAQPSLAPVPDQMIEALIPWTYAWLATDPDLPPNGLAFELISGPPGLSVTDEGAVTWTPGEAQAGAVHRVVAKVTDDGAPPLSATNAFEIGVYRAGETPLIVGQPRDVLLAPGAPATLAVEALGTPPLAYQWRRNGENLAEGNNETYQIPSFGLADAGSYSVEVSNDYGSVESAPASLTPTGVPLLELVDHFEDRRLFTADTFEGLTNNLAATSQRTVGEPLHAGKFGTNSLWLTWRPSVSGVATFSTVGSGFDTLLAVYQGTTLAALEEVASDEDRGGFFTSLLSFNAVAGQDYQVAVDGYAGASGELILSWHLEPNKPTLPEITSSPQSLVAGEGDAVTLTVISPTPRVTYQWFRDGLELAGETQSALSFTASPTRVGTYRARVIAPNGSFLDSADALVEVVPQGIGVGPADQVSADKWQDLFLDEVLPNRIALQGRPVLMGFTSISLGVGARYTELRGASRSLADPSGCRGITGGSRWFRFQVDQSRTVKLSLESTEVAATMTAYHTPPEEPPVMGCVRAESNGSPVTNRFLAVAGVDYLVMVAVAGGGRGRVLLKWEGEAVEVDPEPPEPPRPGFTPDGRFWMRWPAVWPGHYELRLTTDLDRWEQLFQTNVVRTQDIEYVEPQPSLDRARFYHLRQFGP